MSDCQMKEPPFYQCCCDCIYHWQDFHHCTTKVDKESGCVCDQPKGWICVMPRLTQDSERVHSGWPEHSVGCEMYTSIKKQQETAVKNITESDLPDLLQKQAG